MNEGAGSIQCAITGIVGTPMQVSQSLPSFTVTQPGMLAAQFSSTGPSNYNGYATPLPGLLDGMGDLSIGFILYSTGSWFNVWGQSDSANSTFGESGRYFFRGTLANQDTNVMNLGTGLHYYVVTSPQNGVVTGYKDGAVTGTSGSTNRGTIKAATTTGFTIGNSPAGTGGSATSCDGAVLGFFIWPKVLSQQQVQQLNMDWFCFLQQAPPSRAFFGPAVAGTPYWSIFPQLITVKP